MLTLAEPKLGLECLGYLERKDGTIGRGFYQVLDFKGVKLVGHESRKELQK